MTAQKEKLKVILAGTGVLALKIAKRIQEDTRLKLFGVILDKSAGESKNREYLTAIRNIGGEEAFFEDKYLGQADLILACQYGIAVPKQYVEKYRFLNCHTGILPKYKGFSANAWAVLNGADEIGYTIHQMNEKFDNGDIFFVKRFPLSKEQIYADLYDSIQNHIENNICNVLTDIYEKKLSPVKQEGRGFYFTKFFPEMGNLKDFCEESEYIRNLYRSMAKPLGTGVFFWYKGDKFYPRKVTAGSDIGVENYIGVPGKVVNCEEDDIWVKTKDNVIILSDIETESGERIQRGKFKIGNMLGR